MVLNSDKKEGEHFDTNDAQKVFNEMAEPRKAYHSDGLEGSSELVGAVFDPGGQVFEESTNRQPSGVLATVGHKYGEPFYGGDPTGFIHCHEYYFKLNPMDDDDMIQYVVYDLNGDALQWYHAYVDEKYPNTWTPDCWIDFVEHMRTWFGKKKIDPEANEQVVESMGDVELNSISNPLPLSMEYGELHSSLRYEFDNWNYGLDILKFIIDLRGSLDFIDLLCLDAKLCLEDSRGIGVIFDVVYDPEGNLFESSENFNSKEGCYEQNGGLLLPLTQLSINCNEFEWGPDKNEGGISNNLKVIISAFICSFEILFESCELNHYVSGLFSKGVKFIFYLGGIPEVFIKFDPWGQGSFEGVRNGTLVMELKMVSREVKNAENCDKVILAVDGDEMEEVKYLSWRDKIYKVVLTGFMKIFDIRLRENENSGTTIVQGLVGNGLAEETLSFPYCKLNKLIVFTILLVYSHLDFVANGLWNFTLFVEGELNARDPFSEYIANTKSLGDAITFFKMMTVNRCEQLLSTRKLMSWRWLKVTGLQNVFIADSQFSCEILYA